MYSVATLLFCNYFFFCLNLQILLSWSVSSDPRFVKATVLYKQLCSQHLCAVLILISPFSEVSMSLPAYCAVLSCILASLHVGRCYIFLNSSLGGFHETFHLKRQELWCSSKWRREEQGLWGIPSLSLNMTGATY